jgi:hypothetical protein
MAGAELGGEPLGMRIITYGEELGRFDERLQILVNTIPRPSCCSTTSSPTTASRHIFCSTSSRGRARPAKLLPVQQVLLVAKIVQ